MGRHHTTTNRIARNALLLVVMAVTFGAAGFIWGTQYTKGTNDCYPVVK